MKLNHCHWTNPQPVSPAALRSSHASPVGTYVGPSCSPSFSLSASYPWPSRAANSCLLDPHPTRISGVPNFHTGDSTEFYKQLVPILELQVVSSLPKYLRYKAPMDQLMVVATSQPLILGQVGGRSTREGGTHPQRRHSKDIEGAYPAVPAALVARPTARHLDDYLGT